MKTEIINAEKLEKVKKFTEGKWHKMENSTNSIVILQADSVSNAEYSEIADFDCNTLEKLGGFYGIITYFENGGQFMLKCETYMNTEEEDYFEERLSIVYSAEYDFLDLFKKEDDFFDGDEENVAEKIKARYPEVYQHIVDSVLNNLSNYDLTDEEVANIGETWAEDNPDEAFSIGLRNISSYDLKDKIKDAIDEL